MKKYIALLLFVVIGVLPAAAQTEQPIPTDEEIMAAQDNSTIISVNGVDIHKWMYDNALRDALAVARQKGGEEAVDEAAKQHVILHNLVDMEILYQEAQRQKMAVNIAGGVLRTKIISKRYKSVDQFRRALASAGMTEKQFATLWQQQSSVNALVDFVVLKDIAVTNEELQARYEQDKHKYTRKPKIRASHILVQVLGEATPEERKAAKEKAEALHRQLVEGKDFAELAKETGGFPSAGKGGDLGWFSEKRMVPAFSEVAFALPVGEVSNVVETKFGYHIIKKTGQQDPIPQIEEIGTQLEEVIRHEKGRAAFESLKDDLSRRAEIVFHDLELEKAYGAQ